MGMQLSRRSFLTYTAGGALSLVLVDATGARRVVAAELPGGTLPASSIEQFVSPLLVPPTMPRTSRIGTVDGPVDYYEISVRQFAQQILPTHDKDGRPLPATTVWGYGPEGGGVGRAGHSAPSMTIEAEHGVPVRIRWINRLVDDQGRYLPHLLPVDPTLHWANPGRVPGEDGVARTDVMPSFAGRTYVPPDQLTDPQTQYTTYQGPVPIVVHLHGAMGMGDESDGYPEAWFVPDAWDVHDAEYAAGGTWWDFFSKKALARFGVGWKPGEMVAQYPNGNRDSTLWFHDHALGVTRLNVYAGPAGFYLLRGGEHGEDRVTDARTGGRAVLPGPRPQGSPGDGPEPGEIPLAIQDRSFNADGSLFYPDTRAFFDGYDGPYLPHTPVPPVWNPEFFGNTLIVNGQTWPYLDVRQRRYRLRLLNGCGSRFLILDFSELAGARVHQIGNDGGFLEAPHDIGDDGDRLLLGPAERADVILDLTDVRPGSYRLLNVGPDEPYGGGEPGVDFDPADPETTGLVLELRVSRARGSDRSTPAEHLVLPGVPAPASEVRTRKLALIEHMHEVSEGAEGEAPVAAMLGVMDELPGGRLVGRALTWAEDVTENPRPGDTEVWEIYNLTGDAHPVHVHETPFEVLGRAPITQDEETGHVTEVGDPAGPAAGEGGLKDTVVSFPATVTRIRMTFANAGQFVWHCHVLEHEDNEMMRAYRVGDPQPGQPDAPVHHH